jgi:hypothetical protein
MAMEVAKIADKSHRERQQRVDTTPTPPGALLASKTKSGIPDLRYLGPNRGMIPCAAERNETTDGMSKRRVRITENENTVRSKCRVLPGLDNLGADFSDRLRILRKFPR